MSLYPNAQKTMYVKKSCKDHKIIFNIYSAHILHNRSIKNLITGWMPNIIINANTSILFCTINNEMTETVIYVNTPVLILYFMMQTPITIEVMNSNAIRAGKKLPISKNTIINAEHIAPPVNFLVLIKITT